MISTWPSGAIFGGSSAVNDRRPAPSKALPPPGTGRQQLLRALVVEEGLLVCLDDAAVDNLAMHLHHDLVALGKRLVAQSADQRHWNLVTEIR